MSWNRYWMPRDERIRTLIVALTKHDQNALPVLISEFFRLGDVRGEWLRRAYRPDADARLECQAALATLGIHPCTAGCVKNGLRYEKIVEPSKDCRCCAGTGWQHHIEMDGSKSGFTVGWAPGIFEIPKDGEAPLDTYKRVRDQSELSAKEFYDTVYFRNKGR